MFNLLNLKYVSLLSKWVGLADRQTDPYLKIATVTINIANMHVSLGFVHGRPFEVYSMCTYIDQYTR